MKTVASHDYIHLPAGYHLTEHARVRMYERGVTHQALCAAVYFGRAVSVRSAEILAIGRNEVRSCWRDGIDIAPYEGIQVVCGSNGAIMTVYRNKCLRGLRR